MKQNNNMNTLAFAPAMLLRTRVRRSPGGSVPAERTIGIVETLPRAITAREYRETVGVLEERFHPFTYDDAVLILRMAKFILTARFYVPAENIGPGDPHGPAADMRKSGKLIAKMEFLIWESSRLQEFLEKAIETLKPGIDMVNWYRRTETARLTCLDEVKNKLIVENNGILEPKENWEQIVHELGPPNISEEFERLGRRDPSGFFPPLVAKPFSLQAEDLVYEKLLKDFTDQKDEAAATLNQDTKILAGIEMELLEKRALPVQREELTQEQEAHVEEYRKGLESEIREIERTLTERLTARRKNSTAFSGAAAT